jgi:ribulose-phosphate 3-epimerase
MVSDIHPWIEPLAKAKANQITFHIEIAPEYNSLCDILSIIKRKSIRTGVALKPMTPICNTLISLIREDMIDMVLIMTVGKKYLEPGFGGQAFMKDTLGKVTQLRNSFPNLDIQVDGGLDLETVKFAAEAGANVIVSGTGIFKHSEPASAIEQMRDVVLRKICN